MKTYKNHFIFLKNRSLQDKESAFGIPEAMVAAIIIMIVLLSTAVGLSSAFRSSAAVENNNKAAALAQDVIAVSRQSNYKQLFVDTQTTSTALFGDGKCVPQNTSASVPEGTQRALKPEPEMITKSGVTTSVPVFPYKGLVYCQIKTFGKVNGTPTAETRTQTGTDFYIQTQIVYLKTDATFDSSNGSTITNSDGYWAKRVYVTIRWQDISSGADAWNTYRTAYTKTPTASDCAPTNALLNKSEQPAGCVPPLP